jgi:hypothetical protein
MSLAYLSSQIPPLSSSFFNTHAWPWDAMMQCKREKKKRVLAGSGDGTLYTSGKEKVLAANQGMSSSFCGRLPVAVSFHLFLWDPLPSLKRNHAIKSRTTNLSRLNRPRPRPP